MTQALAARGVSTTNARDIRLQRIRILSRMMAATCLATAALLSIAMAVYWAITPTPALFSHAGLPNFPTYDIDIATRIFAFILAMIPLGALAWGLLCAHHCFTAFARGEVFAPAPIRQLRLLAIAVAASALLKPFTGAALSVLLSMRGSAGVKTLAFNIGSDTLIALIFAGTVAVIAWVMSEALAIAEENQQFV